MVEVIDSKIGCIDINRRKQGLDRLLRERAFIKTQIQFCQAHKEKHVDFQGIRMMEEKLKLGQNQTSEMCCMLVNLLKAQEPTVKQIS